MCRESMSCYAAFETVNFVLKNLLFAVFTLGGGADKYIGTKDFLV